MEPTGGGRERARGRGVRKTRTRTLETDSAPPHCCTIGSTATFFHQHVCHALAGAKAAAPLDARTRRRFVACCVPDRNDGYHPTAYARTQRQLLDQEALWDSRLFTARQKALVAFWAEGDEGYEGEGSAREGI